MDVKELQEVIRKHQMWLRNEDGGERANLSSADLRYANLRYANLSNANLRYADLSNANLRYANLSNADLSNANLRYADLSNANLRYANLSNADLSNANLRYADLSNANLSNADLRSANLSVIKHDFWSILLPAQAEIPGLVQALKDGKVDGSTYTGECACLVGTIAKVKGVDFESIPNINPDSSRPIERWFLGIRKGDTPENSVIAQITMEWIDEFLGYVTPVQHVEG